MWSGWDVLQITGLTLLTLFVVQLLVVLGARQFAYPHESWFDVAQKPALALLSELLTYVAVALYMILLVQGKYRTGFWPAIRWNWPGMVAVSFLGLGVLMLGLDFLGRFLPMPKNTPFDQFFARPSDAYLTVAFAVTLGPLDGRTILSRIPLSGGSAAAGSSLGNPSYRAALWLDPLFSVRVVPGERC